MGPKCQGHERDGLVSYFGDRRRFLHACGLEIESWVVRERRGLCDEPTTCSY